MDYNFETIVKLVAATLLPVLLSVGLYLAEKKTRYGKMKNGIRQIVAGVLFGGAAIFGTEFGIPVENAILNVRNAAPLAAGLLFGAPAGLISGVIGGVYRFVATYWGASEFSQIACSVGCLLAGAFGAGCRKFMFDDKKPSWVHGLIIGGTTEVLHMLMVFLFGMDDVFGAYKVVAACAVPMIVCNAVSVMASLLAVSLIGKERSQRTASDKALAKKFFQNRQISQVFQLFLMVCIVVAFSVTLIFTSVLQTKIAYANADNLLLLNLADVEKDIGQTESAEQIRKAVANRHIGKEGGIIVCDEDGKVIYHNGNFEGASLDTSDNANDVKAKLGVRFVATIGKTKCYCMFSQADGLYLVAYLPQSEAMFSRDIAVTILAFMEVIVFAALFVHVYFLVKKQIVDNIHKINGSLAQITGGNLNVQINVRENEEFASLSDDINATVDTLKRYIAEAESRIDQELEFARQIQHSALPQATYTDKSDFDIFASMDAAKEVGGDFYDYWLVDSSKLAFLVADVSGKGIPGALFMMRAKTLIRNLAESGLSIDETFTQANRQLCQNNDAEMFVTAWMGVLDTQTGVLQYVNAGHNPPLVRRCNGECDFLRTRPNFILAGMDATAYKKYQITLNKGDEIFVYTDGITEAADTDNELYGESRLKAVVSSASCGAELLCKTVREDIDRFTKGAEQSDDITMLCVKFNPENRSQLTVEPSTESIQTVVDFLSDTLERWQASPKLANKAQIAVDEIFSNIVYYSGAKSATVCLTDDGNRLSIEFSDDGKPYDPTTATEPDITLSAEEREIGGLGIFMVKKMAAQISYQNKNGNNLLTVTFEK